MILNMCYCIICNSFNNTWLILVIIQLSPCCYFTSTQTNSYFDLSFIHVLFAKSFGYLSYNLLDVLLIIKWLSVVVFLWDHNIKLAHYPFAMITCLYSSNFWQSFLFTDRYHLVNDKQWFLLFSSTSVLKSYMPT